jgi:DNA-binding NtrC family response regulator
MNIGTHEALLIIEDNPGTQVALETLFEPDYRVEIQPDIASAISAMRKRVFAVAILDLGLPDGLGTDLLKVLKDSWPHTEVVVVTAAKDKDVAENCFQLGAFDYFIKPWDNDALTRSIRRAADLYAIKRKLIAAESISNNVPSRSGSRKIASPKLLQTQLLNLVTNSGLKYPQLLSQLERIAVEYALQKTNWNQVHSAHILGVHRNTVVKMMKRQKLPTAANPKNVKNTRKQRPKRS